MSNIKDKVNYLLTTKSEIKAALQVAGANVKEDTPFRQYANEITNLITEIGLAEDLSILQGISLVDIGLKGGTLVSNSVLQEALESAQFWIKLHLFGGNGFNE